MSDLERTSYFEGHIAKLKIEDEKKAKIEAEKADKEVNVKANKSISVVKSNSISNKDSQLDFGIQNPSKKKKSTQQF